MYERVQAHGVTCRRACVARQVERNRQVRHRSNVQPDRVAHGEHAGRHGNGGAAAKRQRTVSSGHDRPATLVCGDVGGANLERLGGRHVGDLDPDLASAQTHANGHADGLVRQTRRKVRPVRAAAAALRRGRGALRRLHGRAAGLCRRRRRIGIAAIRRWRGGRSAAAADRGGHKLLCCRPGGDPVVRVSRLDGLLSPGAGRQ